MAACRSSRPEIADSFRCFVLQCHRIFFSHIVVVQLTLSKDHIIECLLLFNAFLEPVKLLLLVGVTNHLTIHGCSEESCDGSNAIWDIR